MTIITIVSNSSRNTIISSTTTIIISIFTIMIMAINYCILSSKGPNCCSAWVREPPGMCSKYLQGNDTTTATTK